ncbi:protein PLANT CADMIUM RESISTANCE 6-like isoform X2 [Nymphaea colorata]|uniref:protein PLANT CADMIUM RESISTANCE 6-like isoform X2 n=1 Tax=Nymphaea colorata TaxID=210225 RepID=UPI00214EA3AD|nr:protein PLANT CADMIUM RESISTANCE 6-like isoform X2 [Nymphaea colorata]
MPMAGMLTCSFPGITFGQNAEIIDHGSSSSASNAFTYGIIGGSGYGYHYRTKLRGQFQLPEEPMTDYLVHYYCSTCALCQEHRELKNRGFDPTLGWQGTQERSNNGANGPPPVRPAMTK